MDKRIEELLLFLESIEDADAVLIESITEATLEIFSPHAALFEGKTELVTKAVNAVGDVATPVKKAIKKFLGTADDIPTKALDDVGDLKKVADDIPSGKKKVEDDVPGGNKKVEDDIPTKKKKSSKLKKLGKAALAGAASSILFGDDEEQISPEDGTSVTYAPRDSSGRFWPTNFHSGNLTGEQQQKIDMAALFGPNEMYNDLISELNDISPLDEQEIKDARERYAQVYNYWTDIYKTGMTMAYDDQMDKGIEN